MRAKTSAHSAGSTGPSDTTGQRRKRRINEDAPEPNGVGVKIEQQQSAVKPAPDLTAPVKKPRALPQSKPTVGECRVVYEALAQLFPHKAAEFVYGKVQAGACGQRRSVLDSLIGTMLSQNTTDTTSARAFAQLKAAFPTWEQVRTADAAAVELQIKLCGLAATRTERIQAILETLHLESGTCCLEHL